MRLFFETLLTSGQSKKHSWLANRISTCQEMSNFSGYKGVPFVALQLAASEPICICWTKYSLPEFSDIKKFFSSKTPNNILKSKRAVLEWKIFLKKEKTFYYQNAKKPGTWTWSCFWFKAKTGLTILKNKVSFVDNWWGNCPE